MLTITNKMASENILKAVKNNSLIQNSWHEKSEDGRELACLLGAIHPSVTSTKECNGQLMPLWMAEVTVTLFDKIPQNSIIPIALKYGHLINQWHVLTKDNWDSILNKFLVKTIDDSLDYARPVSKSYDFWEQVEKACNQVKKALIERDNVKLKAAAEAAEAAAWAASWAARASGAAEAAAWAARAAEEAAYWAAEAAGAAARAAEAAARAAYWAARASGAAEAAAWAAEKLFNFLLDQIESEIKSCI